MSGSPSTTNHYVVLNALRKLNVPGKPSPTLSQLAEVTGFKSATVYFYIRLLVSEGLVSREKNSRFIQLIGTAQFMPIQKAATNPPDKTKLQQIAKRRQIDRAARKMTKQEEHDFFEAAVKLGKERDAKNLRANDDVVFYDRLSLFRGGCVRGGKLG